MLVLDTDHVSEYQRGTSAAAQRLKQRLDAAAEPYATTIITVEENMRGWMAAIRRTHNPLRQIDGYSRFQRLFHSTPHGTSSLGMLPSWTSSSP